MRPVRYKKGIAVDMRKNGFSYSEIGQKLFLPKSTLSFWLKKVELTPEQREKLKERQIQAARIGGKAKILKTTQAIESIQNSSAQDIQKISKRELWLMGIILYWRENLFSGNKSNSKDNLRNDLENNLRNDLIRSDLKRGVHFSSSDPHLIKFFLKWLKEVGGIEDNEIGLDIFIGEDKNNIINDVIDYWSKTSGFPRDYFSHIYFQKNNLSNMGDLSRGNTKNKSKNKNSQQSQQNQRKNLRKSQFGFLRVRVRASSMLARQMAGWITGIRQYYWKGA